MLLQFLLTLHPKVLWFLCIRYLLLSATGGVWISVEDEANPTDAV